MRRNRPARIEALERRGKPHAPPSIVRIISKPGASSPESTAAVFPDGRRIERRDYETESEFRVRIDGTSPDEAVANDALLWLFDQARDRFPNLIQGIRDATHRGDVAAKVVDLLDAVDAGVKDEFCVRAFRTYASGRPRFRQ